MDIPNMDQTVQVDEQPPPKPPAWAYLVKDSVYVRGDDMNSGDTIYLSNVAYPRILWTKLSRTSWAVLVQKHSIHQRDQISIEPDTYYVIKRATRK